ncbi:MAG: flagellar hook capping FlgD N-terminal domain-containing protein, partial [Pseudomonadota bacterium]
MDIASPTSATNAATPQPQSETASSASALTSDFETFLTLLTAQMRNQDPLNPQDSTEFVSQLASFSAVEQQIKSNETLEALLEQSSQSGFSDFANLVGRSVSIDGVAQFDGSPIALDHVVDSTALSPQLFVRNGSGVVVAQIPVVPGTPLSPWDG